VVVGVLVEMNAVMILRRHGDFAGRREEQDGLMPGSGERLLSSVPGCESRSQISNRFDFASDDAVLI
jgi:hypothetical protein